MNKTLLKKIFLIIAGTLSLIISLFLYIKSYEVYQDEWGIDISFNFDYLIALMLSLMIILYGIIKIKSNDNLPLIIIKITSSSIISFYSMGVFFKAMSKQKPYIDYANYLYIGLIGVIFLGYFILSYLIEKSQGETK